MTSLNNLNLITFYKPDQADLYTLLQKKKMLGTAMHFPFSFSHAVEDNTWQPSGVTPQQSTAHTLHYSHAVVVGNDGDREIRAISQTRSAGLLLDGDRARQLVK